MGLENGWNGCNLIPAEVASLRATLQDSSRRECGCRRRKRNDDWVSRNTFLLTPSSLTPRPPGSGSFVKGHRGCSSTPGTDVLLMQLLAPIGTLEL